MVVRPPITPAAAVKVMINIGAGLDIPTGVWLKGKYGESLLNGGLGFIYGVTGIGNNFKSTVLHFMMLSAMARVMETHSSYASTYDTEINIHESHLKQLTFQFDVFKNRDIIQEGLWSITDKTVYYGNEYFEIIKKFIQDKKKSGQRAFTPFLDRDGKSLLEIPVPTFGEIDSLTEFQSKAELDMLDDNELGESGANMFHQRSGLVKSRLLMELPALVGGSYHYVGMTAQLGKESVIPTGPGPAPSTKKLQFLKGGDKMKGVTDKFTFATNNCWQSYNAAPLINQSTKAAEYPLPDQDPISGDTDLMLVSMRALRSKSGPSGIELQLIVSQRDGVLPSLTEFHFVKGFNRFGISGTLQHYALDIYPGCKIQRTTVRGKIDEDAKLRRAITITSEIAQMTLYMYNETEVKDYLCTPKELYDDLIKAGYDWDMILGSTRGYWTFDNDTNPVPFLSTLDLLRMRKGDYYPYWMDENKKMKKQWVDRLEKYKQQKAADEPTGELNEIQLAALAAAKAS